MIHAEELAASRKLKRNNETSSSSSRRGESESIASSSPGGESRNPHHSRSHRSPPKPPPRTLHPTPSSNSSTVDGHLVRLLDERAAAHASPRRNAGMSITSSGTADSSTQYYKTAQQKIQHHRSSPGKHQHRSSSPMRRPPPPPPPSYPSRTAPEGYSLDQYSHDASFESRAYSECGSSYSSEGGPEPPRRNSVGGEPHPTPPQSQQHAWRHQRHEYGRNLPYVNESYTSE